MDMGRGEERERCKERATWKLTLPCVKEIANGNLLYGSGNSNRGPVSTKRGEMERVMRGRPKREGIYVHLWLIHVDFRKLNIQENKIISSSPITWQIDGERMETVRPKIRAFIPRRKNRATQ